MLFRDGFQWGKVGLQDLGPEGGQVCSYRLETTLVEHLGESKMLSNHPGHCLH